MNKKLNTILFILGATLFNVIVAIISFFLFYIIFRKFIIPVIPESSYSWGFTLVFLACLAVSIGVYRVVLKFLLKKIDIEKYFDPIFINKHKRQIDKKN
ncbi:MAG: leader peptide processing enzyme [Treponema sp.]|jgi:hypothetical protein|nr:leader peptide processing enzyme [Treponema sp.]